VILCAGGLLRLSARLADAHSADRYRFVGLINQPIN
jgi:hypothetical protein